MIYPKYCIIWILLLVLNKFCDVDAATQRRAFFCARAKEFCPSEQIKFYFYTRATQFNPTILNVKSPESILSAPYDFSRPLIVLLHGYTGHKDYSPNTEIRPALLKNAEHNIISVDYNPLVLEPCYYSATLNLPVVANCTAQLLDFMIEMKLFKMENIHIIGFSLGAQTAGMIANFIKSGKLHHITGLDPAKPLFVTAPPIGRLDSEDAIFVDVLHTDVFQRGVLQPAGHVDFYANGGIEQPGCNIGTFLQKGECNHNRAPLYYAESMNTDVGFWGYECEHWYSYGLGMCTAESSKEIALMGYYVDKKSTGLYFFPTNSESPYAKGTNFKKHNYFDTAEDALMENLAGDKD